MERAALSCPGAVRVAEHLWRECRREPVVDIRYVVQVGDAVRVDMHKHCCGCRHISLVKPLLRHIRLSALLAGHIGTGGHGVCRAGHQGVALVAATRAVQHTAGGICQVHHGTRPRETDEPTALQTARGEELHEGCGHGTSAIADNHNAERDRVGTCVSVVRDNAVP